MAIQERLAPGSDSTQTTNPIGVDELVAMQADLRKQHGIQPSDEPTKLGSLLSRMAAELPPEPTAEEQALTDERHEQWLAHKAAQEHREQWNALVAARGQRYAGCGLSTFEVTNDNQRQALATLGDHADAIANGTCGNRNVLLIGPPGTGKDHLLMGLARIAIKCGKHPKWQQGQEIWEKFRDAITNEEPESKLVRRFAESPLLLLSDPVPPRGNLTDRQAEILFRIIDARYSNLRPTWVTLNIADRAEAETRLGPQVVDRLSHDAVVVWCHWESYRKAKR